MMRGSGEIFWEKAGTGWLRAGLRWILFVGMLSWGAVDGFSAETDFEAANRLYEEGNYRRAAEAYAALVENGQATSSVYFNLGNAHFKAGHMGRAIAAYRTGLSLNPRDPDLRFNLQFAREQVRGQGENAASLIERFLTGLTVHEWTLLGMLAYWVWMILLCAREARPAWRGALSGYVAAAGVAAALLVFCLIGSWQFWMGDLSAVVVKPETVVRYGPLEESQVHYQLRDGAEVSVMDRKQGQQLWYQVRDADGREGWLKSADVLLIGQAFQSK